MPTAGQRPHEQELFWSVFPISLSNCMQMSFSCLNRASDHQNQAHRGTVPFSQRLKSHSQIALCRMGGELVMYEMKLQRMTDGSEIREGGTEECCSQRSATEAHTGPLKTGKEEQHLAKPSTSCGNHKCIQDVRGL